MRIKTTAVGTPMGPVFLGAGHEESRALGRLRLAGGVVELPFLFYRVWLHFLVPAPQHQVIAALETSGLASDLTQAWEAIVGEPLEPGDDSAVELVVAILRDRLLLLDLDPAPAAQEALLRSHRLHPLGVGLGNDDEGVGTFRIGDLAAEPLVMTNAISYLAWCLSRAGVSLWETCDEAAALAGVADPSDVRQKVLQLLPLLLEANVARLEPLHTPPLPG